MPEIQFTSAASANRYRINRAANRDQVEQRLASDKVTLERYDAVQRRRQNIEKAVAQQERAIEDRRRDTQASFQAARQRAEQVRFSDTVDNDAAFQDRQALIAEELVYQRANRAAIYAVTQSEFEESLALDQLPQAAGGTQAPDNPASSFESFLADRNSRISERALAERDRSIQQQIDLRIADSNLRASPGGAELPRGALVDVLG